jgi:hypothetical protein
VISAIVTIHFEVNPASIEMKKFELTYLLFLKDFHDIPIMLTLKRNSPHAHTEVISMLKWLMLFHERGLHVVIQVGVRYRV